MANLNEVQPGDKVCFVVPGSKEPTKVTVESIEQNTSRALIVTGSDGLVWIIGKDDPTVSIEKGGD